MKLTDTNINKFLNNPNKEFKIFELGFTKKEKEIFQKFKLPKVDSYGLAYSHYGNLKSMNDINDFLQILGNNSKKNINILEDKIKKIITTVLDGYMKEYFWLNIRISYKDPSFDLERWHTDGKYFMNDEKFQSKFIMVFTGVGTLVLDDNIEEREFFNNNINNREELSDKFKKSKINQLTNDQGLIIISQRTIHSEPKKDSFRMFMQIIPATKEDIDIMSEKHKQIYIKDKEIWQNYKIQNGGNVNYYIKYLKYKNKYINLS